MNPTTAPTTALTTVPKTIDGYEGRLATDPELASRVRELAMAALGNPAFNGQRNVRDASTSGTSARFPGPNPCSLERADLKNIVPADYWVCEKTDGTRALLAFLTYDGTKLAMLVTRAWDVFLVGVRCCPKVLFQGTVFDGEIIGTTWLGFDAIVVAGVPISTRPLSERLAIAARSLAPYQYHPKDALEIRFKTYHRTVEFEPSGFASDGLILTPELSPVVAGRHRTLYKLKSSGRHTVDFDFVPPRDLRVFDTGALTSVGELRGDTNVPTVPCIVEAAHDGTGWVLVKVRDDKTTCNDMLTYTKTVTNIRENLGLDDLKKHWQKKVRTRKR